MFRSKEELEFTISELEQWLERKNSSTARDLEIVCKELITELKQYLDELNNKIDVLKKAEIKDKNKIEQRIITIVLGNRKSFINQAGFFIKRIRPQSYEDIDQMIGFSANMKNELNNFAKITHKSFYASQHLFYKEVENIKKTINKISKLNNDFEKKISDCRYENINEMQLMIKSLKESIDNKFSLLKKLNNLKIRSEQITQDKENALEDIEQMKKSPAYKNHLKDEQKLDEINEKIKKHKLKLEHNFAVIDYALKKYTRIADEEFKLINAYQQDAFDALLEDKDFKILQALQKITQKVLENKIVLKDSKKQKILTELNIINRPYLSELISRYKEIEKEKQKMQEKIDSNKILKEINDNTAKEKSLEKEKELIEKDINSINKSINKIDHAEIKKNIEDKFNVFDISLRLKLVENDK